ncbi:MAG: IclR family transcriptional regulator [Phycisphaeraceae bacterium JB051]
MTHDGQIRDITVTLGSVLHANTSASGKLFLAFKPAKDRDAILKDLDYVHLGPNALTSPSALKKNLIQIAKLDYSFNDRENGEDTASLAVPIRNEQDRVIAAVGVSGHHTEFSPKRLPELIDALKLTASQIQTHLMESNQ